MERYKKAIVVRICLLSLLALAAAGLGVFDVFCAEAEIKASEVFGFQCGIGMGMGVLALIGILRYSRILRDEKALRMQYNRENDERMRAIRARAGMPMLLITSVIMLLAGMVAGYVNITAFYALVLAAAGQLIAACAVKLICMKTM